MLQRYRFRQIQIQTYADSKRMQIQTDADSGRVAKDLWERVQFLMQGTSLTKQERECKLYDAFDKFSHIKEESLH
ncbi:hypothetical protein Tco_0529997 [Tanacetum coccineum]